MADEGRKARAVGRILRLLMGAGMSVLAASYLVTGSGTLLALTAGVFAGEIVFYGALHVVISKFFACVNACAGALIAVTPVILVYLSGGAPGQLGTLLFIGISLVLTAIRSDGGCEVMTIPGMILGKRTHLICVVFSPLDWVEQRVTALLTKEKAEPGTS